MSTFLKIRPVETELFHSDGRTDMTKLIVALRNFADPHINRDPAKGEKCDHIICPLQTKINLNFI
jgi:hypothetical protein